jgi:hypothetical protein
LDNWDIFEDEGRPSDLGVTVPAPFHQLVRKLNGGRGRYVRIDEDLCGLEGTDF